MVRSSSCTTTHHATYVKGANDCLDKLAEARDIGGYDAIVGLEKTLAFTSPAMCCTACTGRT